MLIDSHHALLYRAENILEAGIVLEELEASAEVYIFRKDTLNIAEARLLIDRANHLPLNKPVQIIIIEVGTILIEAQQALLKILEEPPVTTRFILVIKPKAMLLSTILSRCQIVDSPHKPTAESIVDKSLEAFLALSVPERIVCIADRVKKKDDNWFLGMNQQLYKYLNAAKLKPTKELQDYATYLQQRGASKKMLWEALAFRLPVVK